MAQTGIIGAAGVHGLDDFAAMREDPRIPLADAPRATAVKALLRGAGMGVVTGAGLAHVSATQERADRLAGRGRCDGTLDMPPLLLPSLESAAQRPSCNGSDNG
jgi:hypothetical protein